MGKIHFILTFYTRHKHIYENYSKYVDIAWDERRINASLNRRLYIYIVFESESEIDSD